jgi:hypothetical protein
VPYRADIGRQVGRFALDPVVWRTDIRRATRQLFEHERKDGKMTLQEALFLVRAKYLEEQRVMFPRFRGQGIKRRWSVYGRVAHEPPG